MAFRQRRRRSAELQNASVAAIVINALQLAAAVGIALTAAWKPALFSDPWGRVLLALLCLVVGWGAAIDIGDALRARSIGAESDLMEDTLGEMSDVNDQLRAQRHDFLNHLQVIYSLTELGDYEESLAYIEKLHGDIHRIGRAMRTSAPAVNALLAAKEADCRDRGLRLETDIATAWRDCPLDDWEFCRVLSNLIDNAQDALTGQRAPGVIRVGLGETEDRFTFCVCDNGPGIPPEMRSAIFQQGFTTKSEGRGTGLAIVIRILRECGGGIEVASDDGVTAFRGWIPRAPQAAGDGDGASAEPAEAFAREETI